VKVLRLVRGEQEQGAKVAPRPMTPQPVVFRGRGKIDKVTSVDAIESYIVALVAATEAHHALVPDRQVPEANVVAEENEYIRRIRC
jgi:MoxR-like ATPase